MSIARSLSSATHLSRRCPLVSGWPLRVTTSFHIPHRGCLSSVESRELWKQNQPDFGNAKVIYAQRSAWELLRSYTVFSLCSFDFIVDHQAKILSWMRRLLGRRLFVSFMKRTIFGQFMVSEESKAVLDLARRHSQSGVSPLFAYTAIEFHGTHSGSVEAETRARDIWCQQNYDAILRSIEMATKCREFTADKPVITTKVTFLTNYSVLRNLTEVINQQTGMIQALLIDISQDDKQGSKQREMISYLSQLTSDNLGNNLSQLPPIIKVNETAGPSGYHLSGLLTSLAFHISLNQTLQQMSSEVLGLKSGAVKLGHEDIERILKLWHKMKELNKRCSELDVTINYDAEQTFIQPAIETLVLDSIRVFNRQQPFVLNTYQCYLKRTLGVLKRDLEMSQQEGFCFGGKVVRGAYMDEERRLARQNDYPDPVNVTYDVTTDVYFQAIEEILRRSSIAGTKPMRTVVATHNLDTVNFVIKQLQERQLDARSIGVSFAQLLGTRDYISFALGSAGYPAGKLIHYAEPENGLAYLSRRLQENRSGLPSPAIERRLLLNELQRRALRRP